MGILSGLAICELGARRQVIALGALTCPKAVTKPVLTTRGDALYEASLHFLFYLTNRNASGSVPRVFQIGVHGFL